MRSIWRTGALPPDLRPVLLIAVAVAGVGVAYGALSTSHGLPWWFAPLVGCAVLAASSEMLFVGMVTDGANPLVAAATALLLNVRHLPYGLAVSRFLGRGLSRWARIHLINDETVALALSQDDPTAGRRALTWCGTAILVAWPLGAVAGGLLGSVASPAALGLDALFPAVILALLVPHLRQARTRRVMAGAMALVSLLVPWAPLGLAPLAALIGLPNLARGTTR